MNEERDKFLTEVMGECWHEWEERTEFHVDRSYYMFCTKCNKDEFQLERHGKDKPIDFSSWDGFGKLWKWVSDQENMMCGLASRYNGEQAKIKLIYIDPNTFADAVYNYLKEQP